MRRYHVLNGSPSYFDDQLSALNIQGDEMSQKVLEFDQQRILGTKFILSDCLIVRNNHYLNLVESALSRLGSLIEDLTSGDADIFVHNPPLNLLNHIHSSEEHGRCTFEKCEDNLPRIASIDDVKKSINLVKQSVLGQDAALDSIGKSLFYLSKVKREKPFVLMFYGKSSLGKTETAKAIARVFYDGKMLEKHMSMFGTTGYASYLFGDKLNERSLGYDLFQRESNLVFLDEIDKCSDAFHAAFYSLFDSPRYLDTAYEVDIRNLVVILTSNYLSEKDIRKHLGDPIFNRIDKCIEFVDFSPSEQIALLEEEIDKQINEISESLDKNELFLVAARKISTKGANGRVIKFAVREAIEEALYESC